MRDYKIRFAQAWDETSLRTTTGRPIESIICPAAPLAGIPHDFNIYWGYTSMFNLLDYPSTILPLKNFQISSERDPLDHGYLPLTSNPYDEPNYVMYNPKLYQNQPSSIQIVSRPFDDEELIEVTSLIDGFVDDSNSCIAQHALFAGICFSRAG